MGSDVPETVAAIVAAHRAATMTPAQTVARSYQRIRAYNDPAVFISLRDEKDALAEAEALVSNDAASLPLLGVPVAVKDNIDAQGMPTTAACPAFSYSPARDSTSRGSMSTPARPPRSTRGGATFRTSPPPTSARSRAPAG